MPATCRGDCANHPGSEGEHDPLAGPELENLVNDLRRCTMPYTCPHGRPTMIEMNFRELEKKFGRSQ